MRSKNCGFFAILTFQDEPSAGIGVVDVQKLRVCSILNMLARPSARIVRVEALSLRRRANLLLAKWSLEVVAWFARLLSESRGRGVDPSLIRRSFSRQKSQLLSANVVRGRSSGWKTATFKYNCSTQSTVLQLRLHNGTFQSEN